MPCDNGKEYTTLELYSVFESLTESKLPEEFKFELDYVVPTSISKEDIVGSLSNSVQILAPYLMSVDSDISKREPILHLTFRGIYLYYAVFGKLDISKFSLECDNLINEFCKYIMDSYYLYQYHQQSDCKPEDLLILKNSINLISAFFCCSISHARLVDLRSKATLKILDARANSMSHLLINSVAADEDALDKVIRYTDYSVTLPKYCMPDDYLWIDVSKIMHHIVKSSLTVDEAFSVDYSDLDSYCICNILKRKCTHRDSISRHPNFNFCLTYWPSRIFMEFSFISLEEYYSKIYLTYFYKKQHKTYHNKDPNPY